MLNFRMTSRMLVPCVVSIKPVTTKTTTNFESKQSDQHEGWLLNFMIASLLCRGRGICGVMETRLKIAFDSWKKHDFLSGGGTHDIYCCTGEECRLLSA